MPATPRKPRRMRLNIVGPIEDRPRMLRAYGRACDGEAALVLRPTEGKGVLVLVTREGAWKWEAGQRDVDDGLTRARATLHRGQPDRFVVVSGRYQGTTFRSYDPVGSAHNDGDTVEIVFNPDDQFAHMAPSGDSDAPLRPEAKITPAEAVKLVKHMQKKPPAAGPIALRGRWTGVLVCDEGTPRVELKRKLATYGTLHVTSAGTAGWSWRFERAPKWFTEEGITEGAGYATLASAIEAGAMGALRLVEEACSFRDTQRRAAHDPVYAERHPIKVPAATRNPTERFAVRPPRGKRKKAPPPAPVEAPVELPDTPATAPAVHRMAAEVEAEGDALAAVRGVRWLWEEPVSTGELSGWFEAHGLESVADAIRAYRGGADQPLDAFFHELDGLLANDLDTLGIGPGETAHEDAQAHLAELRATLQSTPLLVERARKLIRHATRLAESPLCRGKEQREAVEAIHRATHAYEEARRAIVDGRAWDAQRTLRRIGERVALSAAKSARSCSLGQRSLTAEVGHRSRKARSTSRKPKAEDLGERVVTPLVGEPQTAAELRARLTGHANTFTANPTASTAKKWMKGALLHLDLPPRKLSARTRRFDDLGGGQRIFVTVLLPSELDSGETNEKLRMIADATPKGLTLDGWDYTDEAPRKTRKPAAKTTKGSCSICATDEAPKAPWRPYVEGERVVYDGELGRVTRIPPYDYGPDDMVSFQADGQRIAYRIPAGKLVRVNDAPSPNEQAEHAEEAVDPDKDKALLDAFSAAIAAAMGEAA